ncbi:MAG: hypothetical protein WB439_12955 [Acidobacteriaceae bacterium]
MKALRHAPWLLLYLLLPCAHAHAQAACPWLTQGTAAAYLQAPVTTFTNLSSSNEGSCLFTLHQDTATSALKITVTTTTQPSCPAGKPLTAIGTEATLCSAHPARNRTTDTVSGRVRNLYFTIELTIIGKTTPPLTPEQRQSIVQQAAQEVAGNLF